MDQEVIREGLRDVFGSFEDFHRNLSTVGQYGTIHFGVVPNASAPRPNMISNSYHNHRNNISSPQPSAKECIQRMTSDLIANPPILPLDKLPAFNKSYLTAPPSSSSRSTPEQSDHHKRSATAKRKIKTDSDSELDKGRDRRKRTKEPTPVDKPGTSHGFKHSAVRGDDQMRELFGDDEKDCLKRVSPDSGFQSTENEIMDDCVNTQSILNMFTRVESPLSPLPVFDKGLTTKAVQDRIGKEAKEKREKEEEDVRRMKEKDRERERERAKKEQEEKDRRRKENEKRERKEAERRESERKAEEVKKAAEQRRLEEEAEAERAAESRRVAEEELEKTRLEEEERSRKARIATDEAEKRRIAMEDERRRTEEAEKEEFERKKLKELERRRKEKQQAEDARLKEIKKREKERALTATPDLSNQFCLERLKGELSLKTLSPSKLKQLEEMGRTNNRIMSNKPDVPNRTFGSEKDLDNGSKQKDGTKDSTSRSKHDKSDKKKSSEKDHDRASEKAENESKRDKKNKVAVIKAQESSVNHDISPRPSSAAAQTPPSTSNGREFRCACNECTPAKVVRIERAAPDVSHAAFYNDLARSKKRSADQEHDPLLKIILYFESVIYFATSSLSSVNDRGDKTSQYNLMKESCEMLKVATQRFVTKEYLNPLQQHLAQRARALSLRIQSVLAYHLYQCKSAQVWKIHHILDSCKDVQPIRLSSSEKVNDDDGAGSAVVQPSPASSVHSSSNSGSIKMVTVPEEMYNNQKYELRYASHLMYAHRLWGDAIVVSGRNISDTSFFNHLESICGHLCVNTPIERMCTIVMTCVTWLRQEYELEKTRPHPHGESKRLSAGSSTGSYQF